MPADNDKLEFERKHKLSKRITALVLYSNKTREQTEGRAEKNQSYWIPDVCVDGLLGVRIK